MNRISILLYVLLLTVCLQASDSPCIRYERALYPHWIDADGDGLNTRKEVLQRSNLERTGPKVGKWFDPYTGTYFTAPESLQIDHVVALSEAHKSGAWEWSESRRKAFANDLGVPENLLAVNGPVNEDKGDKDPAKWLPPDTSYWKKYVRQWLAIKVRWGLAMDSSEWQAVQGILGEEVKNLQRPLLREEYRCRSEKKEKKTSKRAKRSR